MSAYTYGLWYESFVGLVLCVARRRFMKHEFRDLLVGSPTDRRWSLGCLRYFSIKNGFYHPFWFSRHSACVYHKLLELTHYHPFDQQESHMKRRIRTLYQWREIIIVISLHKPVFYYDWLVDTLFDNFNMFHGVVSPHYRWCISAVIEIESYLNSSNRISTCTRSDGFGFGLYWTQGHCPPCIRSTDSPCGGSPSTDIPPLASTEPCIHPRTTLDRVQPRSVWYW